MLFGEYSVLAGSWSLLIPYRKVNANFAMLSSSSSEPSYESSRKIRTFARYLQMTKPPEGIIAELDINSLYQDLDAGLFFKSNIPEKYGLGSSAALCAAIYDGYGLGITQSPEVLRTVFSFMESFFHGSSSGMDPLPVYFNKEIALVNNKLLISEPEKSNRGMHIFLVDTNIQSQTAPFVRYFNEKMTENNFRKEFVSEYIPLVNYAVDLWLDDNLKMESVIQISELQSYFFKKMIPESFQPLWTEGIKSRLYALKLCGSGGGGMLMGFTQDLNSTRIIFLNKGYTITPCLQQR
jgi:mevalonate kinase